MVQLYRRVHILRRVSFFVIRIMFKALYVIYVDVTLFKLIYVYGVGTNPSVCGGLSFNTHAHLLTTRTSDTTLIGLSRNN